MHQFFNTLLHFFDNLTIMSLDLFIFLTFSEFFAGVFHDRKFLIKIVKISQHITSKNKQESYSLFTECNFHNFSSFQYLLKCEETH